MKTRLTFFAVGMALLFGGAQTGRPTQPRQLTLAERVAYQYAIEEIYWRHRIWPKENPRPKPSLDAVMSPTQIEKKVNDYLRNSQLLAEKWQRPITTEQLQAELERIARDTKQSFVLREIFAALGNDPFVIAECLARPILAGCLVGDFTAHAKDARKLLGSSKNSVARLVLVDDATYKLPESFVQADCTDDTWTATSITNAASRRLLHTAVWTGAEMIVWGGGSCCVDIGGRYDPATDSWTSLSTVNAPETRWRPTAIWTGVEMLVWGGTSTSGNNNLNTGGKYNPGNDSWLSISTSSAPSPRFEHTAVWTGAEMIAWGGCCDGENQLNTGGRYNPTTDSWIPTNTNNAPAARGTHTAIWTGSEMIVWGGEGVSTWNTGGRYNPNTNSWTSTNTNAPVARIFHSAIWTGGEMIVWGGNGIEPPSYILNTGGRYDPHTDSWRPTSTLDAPVGREVHTAIWTGTEMIVWGGTGDDKNPIFNSGGRYNPGTDSWVATSTTNAPVGRSYHTAVWTGREMIVWGGFDINNSNLNTGGRYCAEMQASVPQSGASRKTHGAAGSFDVLLPLTGTPGIECRTGGTTSDHVMIISFTGNVLVNGNPQAAVTSGIGTIGSEGKPNGGMVFVSGNTVTVPLTNVANAQTINITLFDVNSTSNFVIPMSVLAGDVNGNGAVNAGDIVATKSWIGQPVNATNFRADVNAGGAINATDVSIVKSYTGTGLP